MTTTNRVRAGAPVLHRPVVCKDGHGIRWVTDHEPDRIDSSQLPDDRAAFVMGNTDMPGEMHDDEDGPMKMLAWAMLIGIGFACMWLLYQVAPMIYGVFA